MIDERGHPPPPRSDQSFADDVHVVDVEMRQVGDQRIRETSPSLDSLAILAVEPLRACRASDADDGARLELLAQPGVAGDLPMMRLRNPSRKCPIQLSVSPPHLRAVRVAAAQGYFRTVRPGNIRLLPFTLSPSTPSSGPQALEDLRAQHQLEVVQPAVVVRHADARHGRPLLDQFP